MVTDDGGYFMSPETALPNTHFYIRTGIMPHGKAQAAVLGGVLAVYTVRIGDAVHVLHAFQKKSKSGIATPQPDIQLIEKRLKALLARHGLSGR